MIRTLTYTASLTPSVHVRLNEFLEQQRLLWNAGLDERIQAYRKAGKTITRYEQQKSLTVIRRDDGAFRQFHAAVQRSVLIRLHNAFQRFFKHGGFPRFKGRVRGIRSFDIDDPVIQRSGNRHSLWVKGIGRLKFRGEIPGLVKAGRVVRSACRVSVQLIVELPDESGEPTEPVGIDVGLKHRAVLSTGETIEPVKLDRRALKRAQRKVSRAVKGSASRRKKVYALQKAWNRVRSREHNSLHRITTALVRKHNRIAVEDLNIGNMVKNNRLARSIMEQQWGNFTRQLAYKAESAGGELVKVSPSGTSRKCSECGNFRDISLSERVYTCSRCGLQMDRDRNAANNILNRGFPIAGGLRPGVPEYVSDHLTGLPGDGTEKPVGVGPPLPV